MVSPTTARPPRSTLQRKPPGVRAGQGGREPEVSPSQRSTSARASNSRFEAYRHKQKATNLQVVLEAISTKHDELSDIIKKSAFSTAPVNPLFPADPSAVRYVGGGSVQIGFSATPQQEEVIDRIGSELGFDTRSTWIAPVLNAFLPGRKDSAPNRG